MGPRQLLGLLQDAPKKLASRFESGVDASMCGRPSVAAPLEEAAFFRNIARRKGGRA